MAMTRWVWGFAAAALALGLPPVLVFAFTGWPGYLLLGLASFCVFGACAGVAYGLARANRAPVRLSIATRIVLAVASVALLGGIAGLVRTADPFLFLLGARAAAILGALAFGLHLYSRANAGVVTPTS